MGALWGEGVCSFVRFQDPFRVGWEGLCLISRCIVFSVAVVDSVLLGQVVFSQMISLLGE